MCALLSGLYIGGDHEGVGGSLREGLAKKGKKCVFNTKKLILTNFHFSKTRHYGICQKVLRQSTMCNLC